MKMRMIMCIAALGVAITLMSFTSDESTITIPESLQKEVLGIAVEHQALSQKDVDAMIKYNVVQRCVDVFMKTGDFAATVDELAQTTVEAGYYNDVTTAKAGLKAQAEAFRKNGSNWALLYKVLGL